MISACQFGITLASLGLGALAEPVIASLLTGPLAALHVPHELVHPLALAIALTLVSCLHMLLGEMVPKNLALTGPEHAAMMLAPPLLVFVRLFRPIIISLTAVATAVLKLLRITPVSEIGDVLDRDSVAALIGESSEEGLLHANQRELLSEALAFEETKAEVVAMPLKALVTVEPDVTPGRCRAARHRHRLLPLPRSSSRSLLDRSEPRRLHPPGRRLRNRPGVPKPAGGAWPHPPTG